MLNLKKRVVDISRRYQVTLATGLVLFFLAGLSLLILGWLAVTSVQRNQDIRAGFLDRDLREMASRLDSEERLTFEKNLTALIPEYRNINPLVLPRQYYVALPPSNIRSTPRLPPRNCFLKLEVSGSVGEKFPSTRICPYFAENKSFGRYLFLTATLNDNSLVALRPGDTTINADALKITIEYNSKIASWWLTYQTTQATSKGRFEITAIREKIDGVRERDRRVEGWAYTQIQADGSQVVNLIARIDFKEFMVLENDAEEAWPPADVGGVHLSLARKDVSADGSTTKFGVFKPLAKSILSGYELAESFVKNHAELSVMVDDTSFKKYRIFPNDPQATDADFLGAFQFFSVIDGDLLIKGSQLVREHILPDTNLIYHAVQSANVVPDGVWQAIPVLVILSVGGLIFAVYLVKNLLIPVFVLTRQSHRLLHNTSGVESFSYGEKVSEIGILARSLNELLDETRRQAQREASRRLDEIKIREDNLRVIGHEIRAPLQALMSMYPEGGPARSYLNRMDAALPHLQDSVEAREAFGNRELVLEKTDVALVTAEFAAKAHLLQIDNVEYVGRTSDVLCAVDFDAIEDVFSNIIKNAARFRDGGTTIQISLELTEWTAIIKFQNYGPCVPIEHMEKIFEYGFSSTPRQRDAGAGIGLYVAKLYVEKMGGSICAKNLDAGVFFEIHLPLVK